MLLLLLFVWRAEKFSFTVFLVMSAPPPTSASSWRSLATAVAAADTEAAIRAFKGAQAHPTTVSPTVDSLTCQTGLPSLKLTEHWPLRPLPTRCRHITMWRQACASSHESPSAFCFTHLRFSFRFFVPAHPRPPPSPAAPLCSSEISCTTTTTFPCH